MQVMLALHDGTYTSSSIGKHFWIRDKHSSTPKDLTTNFTILTKCNKCLIYDMFFINDLRPSPNVQCDSILCESF